MQTQLEELASWHDQQAEGIGNPFAEWHVGAAVAIRGAMAEGERRATAAIVAWLRDGAGKTRDDLARLHAGKMLTRLQTAEWELLISIKAGIASAISRGDHLPSAVDA